MMNMADKNGSILAKSCSQVNSLGKIIIISIIFIIIII